MQDQDRRTIDGNWEPTKTEVPEVPLVAKTPKPKAKKAPPRKQKGGPKKPPVQLQLFHNIQFIYELVLAKLELDCMGVEYVMDENMRSFKGKDVPDKERILRRSAYVAAVDGAETDYAKTVRMNRTKSVNQFLTHWIYPYKGKFHPQMVRALLNVMGLERGEVVLDPFVGSGTTAVEAKILGINCIGFDVSKVCVMVSRAKTQSVDVIDKIEKEMGVVLEYARGTTLFTFEQAPKPLKMVIKGVRDLKARNFFQVGELVAHSAESRRGRAFTEAFVENIEKMSQSVKDVDKILKDLGVGFAYTDIKEGDARALPLENDSVDGILTSPPYSIALDYVKNDSHAFEALGLKEEDIREGFIGVRGKAKEKVSLYNQDMARAYEQMYRVLKPGRCCTIVVGNATIEEKELPTVQNTIEICTRLGFELVHNVDKIIYGLYNVMQKENILVFRKKG
jgi:tRNA G10  N-methylase Trm11